MSRRDPTGLDRARDERIAGMSNKAGDGIGPAGGASVRARSAALDDTWESVDVAEILEPWLSRLTDLGFDIDASDVMSVIVASGEVDLALRVVEAADGLTHGIGTEAGEEALRQFVPHTRVFFHRPNAVDLGWDAVTAAGVFVTTGSGSLASGLTILRRTIQTFKHLSLDEMDVVLVMRGICGTRDRHRTTISAGELAAVYRDSPVSAEAVASLLVSLVKKGVVTEVDGGWRLVP
jgi:hypothetical protein